MSSPVLEVNPSARVSEAQNSHRFATLTIKDVTTLAALTLFILLIHGYHPFADDAGIYVAGICKLLDPSLFSVDPNFVLAHTRLSVFSHLVAAIIRIFQIPLCPGLFGAYLLSTFVFLYGCLQLSRRIFQDVQLRWGATLLAAALFTLPVAATSLWVMDPYVTARSFSTPLSLFTLIACMDRDWKRAALWFAAVSLLHPLMAAYLAAFLVVYVLVNKCRWRTLAAACVATFAGSALVYFATRHSPPTDGYREAVLTRTYFFLSFWRWYEICGLVAPLALMGVTAYRTRNVVVRNLCLSSIVTGGTASLVAAVFVHSNGSFFLARIQPLRAFQMIYIVGILLLGAFIAGRFRGRRAAIGVVLLLLISSLMFLVQKQVYTTSAHIEWPFAAPSNPWQQAFLWIRANTPRNAVFALDSNYTKVASEDTQGFRATALRSVFADDLKDGGVASIFPELAPAWKSQRDLDLGLDQISDKERIARLSPAGVTWVVLRADALTQLICPYRNQTVVVCKLP